MNKKIEELIDNIDPDKFQCNSCKRFRDKDEFTIDIKAYQILKINKQRMSCNQCVTNNKD